MTFAFSSSAFSRASFSSQSFALRAATTATQSGGAFAVLWQRRIHALNAVPITTGRPILGRPALLVRPSKAQIAAMVAEQARAAQWADDEEAIAALLLAA